MMILLDIDGVMVPAQAWKQPMFLSDGFPAFAPGAVSALRHIIDATGAGIMLVTSHRFVYTINEWQAIFKHRGISAPAIEILPEAKAAKNRKEEILLWIGTTPQIPDIIIIDDDKSLNGLPENLKARLLQPSGTVGLTVQMAENFLSGV